MRNFRPCRDSDATASPRHRGVVIIAVLAMFAVIVSLSVSWARSVVRDHRFQRLAEEHVQAQWLVEAGLRRGAALRLADAEYDREEWKIAAGELLRADDALVHIRIEPADGVSGRVRITARALYPANRPRVQASRTVVFRLPPEPAS